MTTRADEPAEQPEAPEEGEEADTVDAAEASNVNGEVIDSPTVNAHVVGVEDIAVVAEPEQDEG